MFINRNNDIDSTKKDDSDKIIVKNVNINALKLMLKYFYNEKIDIQNKWDIQLVREVFKLVQKYEVKRSLKKIEIFVKTTWVLIIWDKLSNSLIQEKWMV